MSTLTVEFNGVLEDVLNALVKKGFAKTKAEALRMVLLRYGEELGLVQKRLHQRSEDYMWDEIKQRLKI